LVVALAVTRPFVPLLHFAVTVLLPMAAPVAAVPLRTMGVAVVDDGLLLPLPQAESKRTRVELIEKCFIFRCVTKNVILTQ
jgi:hypothetical protein